MAKNTKNHDRVVEATSAPLNKKIDREAWQRIADYSGSSKSEISARIEKLNKEWDIERLLGVNMSTLAMTGILAGQITKNKNWFI